MSHLIELLRQALAVPDARTESIKRFQAAVWEGDREALGVTESELDLFTELAFDLDHYVEDPSRRREDPSYYGEERLAAEIEQALRQLERPNR